MDLYPNARDIQLLALRAIAGGGEWDGYLRAVFRGYSKAFHTPLHEVEGLPLEYVLQHFWENYYENLPKPVLQEIIAVESGYKVEEVKQIEAKEEEFGDKMRQFALDAEARAKARAAKAKQGTTTEPLEPLEPPPPAPPPRPKARTPVKPRLGALRDL